MSTQLMFAVTVFVLGVLVGFEVISKVPATLHTPLMSATNAVHGIILVGAVLLTGTVRTGPGYGLAFTAVAFATANVVGGYAVTGRMLKMFRRRTPQAQQTGPGSGRPS
jgi:NAD(P) transhydrogenase subunit alpha